MSSLVQLQAHVLSILLLRQEQEQKEIDALILEHKALQRKHKKLYIYCFQL